MATFSSPRTDPFYHFLNVHLCLSSILEFSDIIASNIFLSHSLLFFQISFRPFDVSHSPLWLCTLLNFSSVFFILNNFTGHIFKFTYSFFYHLILCSVVSQFLLQTLYFFSCKISIFKNNFYFSAEFSFLS